MSKWILYFSYKLLGTWKFLSVFKWVGSADRTSSKIGLQNYNFSLLEISNYKLYVKNIEKRQQGRLVVYARDF